MIFLGDVAVPGSSINFPDVGESEVCCFNCEGYLENGFSDSPEGVYNNLDAILSLPFDNLVGVIANNHITDVPDGIAESIKLANGTHLCLTGGGGNIKAAARPKILNQDEFEVAIIAAGWHVIGCKTARSDSDGAMPLNFRKILEEIRRQSAQNRKSVVFLHWGYELERYPHPSHRQFAHTCIDAGAHLVLGCHAHCMQGFESYKGRGIFYGLGNAIFQQGFYYGGRLRFPDYCETGLCVKWDVRSNEPKVACISFANNTVTVGEFSNPEELKELSLLSTFSGFSHRDYIKFFRDNRVKRKGLPIFHEPDHTISYKIKEQFVKFRSSVLGYAFSLKLINYKK